MKFLKYPSYKLSGKLATFFFAYLFLLIYMVGASHFMTWLYPPPPEAPMNPFAIPDEVPPLRFSIFMMMIFAPIWEEMVFRHSFGLIVKKWGSGFLLPAMIISSFIFAQGHPNGTQMNVMHQGVAGMVFFYVYAKNGYKPIWNIVLHSAWNATVFFAPTWIW
jgi:membrane protease YdiL (CAAX protease family)